MIPIKKKQFEFEFEMPKFPLYKSQFPSLSRLETFELHCSSIMENSRSGTSFNVHIDTNN